MGTLIDPAKRRKCRRCGNVYGVADLGDGPECLHPRPGCMLGHLIECGRKSAQKRAEKEAANE
jgi:hypothetical protein